MWKGFVLGVIVTIVVAAGCVWLVVRQGVIPAAAAQARPVPLENWVAGNSLRASLQRDAPKGRNPIKLTEDNLIKGIKFYSLNCIVCHGTAKGNAGATAIARGEYPAPPQFASEGVEDDPPGWTFWKIKNGIRWTGMPAWGSKLQDPEIWTITLFLSNMDKLPPAAEQVWREAH
jgi:mono/diheme cytochrome c family protein